MAVFHIVCKIILIYLFVSLVLAVYDVFRTFYGVITKQIQGKDDDMEIFGKLEDCPENHCRYNPGREWQAPYR